jgi:hypothetical protein
MTDWGFASPFSANDELERPATERGPDHEADMLADLRGRRAKDEKVFAYLWVSF